MYSCLQNTYRLAAMFVQPHSQFESVDPNDILRRNDVPKRSKKHVTFRHFNELLVLQMSTNTLSNLQFLIELSNFARSGKLQGYQSNFNMLKRK